MPRDLTGEYRHVPVLADGCRKALQLAPGSIFVDCTLGGAGHTRVLAPDLVPDGLAIGIDQDEMALQASIAAVREEAPQLDFRALHGNFADLDSLLVDAQIPGVDGFLFDLGVSSPQLDFSERGFSYNEDAPLDMRMDPGKDTPNAAEIVNTLNEADLARILRRYGEEKWAARIAAHIVRYRSTQPIQTTGQLASLVKEAIPAAARRSGGHPARRTFQALRIAVNDELGSLEKGLDAALRWLNPGGRVAVISYHSLEDRIVKQAFAEAAKGCICPPDVPLCTCGITPAVKVVTKQPILPSEDEVEANPRARSAKLRVAEKL